MLCGPSAQPYFDPAQENGSSGIDFCEVTGWLVLARLRNTLTAQPRVGIKHAGAAPSASWDLRCSSVLASSDAPAVGHFPN